MSAEWKRWIPEFEDDELTLGEAKASLPGANPEDISTIVRLLENPKSPFALKGAVTLERHDCIHILLGRGLLNQDEAFVIGYTMGTSKDISKFEEFLFKQISVYLYPKNYRFNKRHLQVYKLGLEKGRNSKGKKIYEFPFEEYYDWKLGNLRRKIGVNKEKLKEIYRIEQKMFPHTIASKRLPV